MVDHKDRYIQKLIDKYGENTLKGEYLGSNINTDHLCLRCKKIFTVKPIELIVHRKHCLCKICKPLKLIPYVEEKNKSAKNKYIEKLEERHGKNSLIGEYIADNIDTDHICDICKVIYKIKPLVLLQKTQSLCENCFSKLRKQNKPTDIKIVKELLFNKYAKSLKMKDSSYISMNREADFKCVCGNTWKASPTKMLHGDYKCGKCHIKPQHLPTDIKIVKKKILEKYNGTIRMKSSSYISMNKKAKFKCDCGNIWETPPYDLLRRKYGCGICDVSKKKSLLWTHELFLDKFKKLNTNLEVIGKYKGSNVKIKMKCIKCELIWNTIPSDLLRGTGCPSCAKIHFSNFGNPLKEIEVHNKVFRVQGYEGDALYWMAHFKGIDINKIHGSDSGKVPRISYIFENLVRNYYPDFLIGQKTLVEVKSYYTLFSHWDKTVAKAKACVKEGYNIKLIVVNGHISYPLPKLWYKQTKEEIEGFLIRKKYNTYRILAFDPGVVNMAWAIIEIKHVYDISIVSCGMIKNTIKSIKNDIKAQANAFIAEIYEHIGDKEIHAICIERFMSRGNKGLTMELVGTMIGVILGQFTPYEFRLVTAAQWKNDLNRKINLKKLYKKFNCPDHIIDAIFIGIYNSYKFLGRIPFNSILNSNLKGILIPSIKKAIETYNNESKM